MHRRPFVHRRFNSATVDLQKALPNAPMLRVGLSDNHWFDRWLGIGLTGATVLCKTCLIYYFLSFFFVFCFARAFYFILGIFFLDKEKSWP